MNTDQGQLNKPRVVVVDYNPDWPKVFEGIKAHVWPHVSDLAIAIEHVGSTAVPGLAAKPIIDLDIVIEDETVLFDVIDRLAPLGYVHRGELGVEGRHAFFQPDNTPLHHLYVCLKDCLGVRNHLTLRDHLRQHPEAVQGYAMLKKLLAAEHPNDIEAYVEGKTAFIVQILSQYDLLDRDLDAIHDSNRKKT